MNIFKKLYFELLKRVEHPYLYADHADVIRSGRIKFEGQFGDTVTLIHCNWCGYDFDEVLDWCPICGAGKKEEF